MTSWTPEAESAYHEYKQIGPLWMRVEDALGKEEPLKLHWHRAASNWLRLVNEIEHNEQRPKLDNTLTRPQKISRRLLVEWWNGHCQKDEISVATRAWIQSLASTVEPEPEVSRRKCPGSTRSLYQSVMFSLFKMEFVPLRIDFTGESDADSQAPYTLAQFYESLRSTRQQALLYASIQKIALRHLFCDPPSANVGDECDGITLDPCSWISLQTGRAGLPYFLWDVTARETITVAEIQEVPKYICISHTWGRWRIRDATIVVKGVPWPIPRNTRFDVAALPETFCRQNWKTRYVWFDLFCIPQDGSELADMEIARQSTIFRNSSSSIVWFNDVEAWQTLPGVIAWLSLKFLQGTSSADLYETQHKLDKAFSTSDKPLELAPEESLTATGHEQDAKSMSLWRSHSNSKRLILTSLNGWFSSLWTLQEAFLCPESILYSRHWEPLRDRTSHLIALDTLFALETVASRQIRYTGNKATKATDFSNWQSYLADNARQPTALENVEKMSGVPLGVKQLAALSRQTKLDNLWNSPCPADVLVLGNLRQCTESRAQAIMCILGATDWYTREIDKTKRRSLEDDLIMGLYPLAFLREVSTKLGASFYCTVKSAPNTKMLLRSSMTGKGIGSMLPFAPGYYRGSVLSMNSVNYTTGDHPDIATWQIQRNGFVKVSRAGIVATSSRFLPRRLQRRAANVVGVQAWVIDCHRESSAITQTDLHSWLNRQSKLYQWYAVSLCRDSIMQSGIILKSAPLSLPHHSLYLVKTGYFQTTHREFPSSKSVDWVIL